MRNRETPIDTKKFFSENVDFNKEGDDLIVVEKPNNGEQIVHQEAHEIEPADRLKTLRKDFNGEVVEENKTNKFKKQKKQKGVFVDMNDEVAVAEKDIKTVINPAEVVQAEAVKTDTKEEKKQKEKPEVVFGIENNIIELKKKKADIKEIRANYEKVFNESQDERIKERTADKIQKRNEEINKVDAEIAKLIKQEDIRKNGVDLEDFNKLRDGIEAHGQTIRDLASSDKKEDLMNRAKLIEQQTKDIQELKEIFEAANFEYSNKLKNQIAVFEKRGQSIRTGKMIDSEGKEIILTEEERKKLIDDQDKAYEEYLKNKQELEEIFKAAKADEVK